MEAKDIKTGLDAFNLICSALESDGIFCKKYEEDLAVLGGIRVEGIPITLFFLVDKRLQTIQLESRLDLKMGEEKRAEGAIATLIANYGMSNGCFEYDLSDGSISFRLTTAFGGSRISQEAIGYMVYLTSAMVSKYSPKFSAINDGTMTISDFIDNE